MADTTVGTDETAIRTDDEQGGGWQLDGDAARAYEAHLVPAIFDGLAARLVDIAGVAPGDRVLDVACGTGVVARTAGRIVTATGRVVGVDVNPAMLDEARRAARGPDIAFLEGDAVALPLSDDEVDVVLCQQAVQFLPDPVAAVAEMARVAVPGGRVAFSVLRGLDVNPVYQVFHDALGTHVGPAAEAMIAAPFTGDAQEQRAVAAAAGLRDVTVRIVIGEERFPSIDEFVTHEAASSPLSRELAALDPTRRAALVDHLTEALSHHLDDLGLVFHNDTLVVTGVA